MNRVRCSLERYMEYMVLLMLFIVTCSCIPVVTADSVVSILPSSQEVYPGDGFDVYVYIEPETPVAGAQLDISYDNTMLRADSVDGSDFFEQDGTTSIFIGGTVDNSQGSINGLFAVTLGKAEISTAENFAQITFTALERTGDCSITLSNVILSDPSGNQLPVTLRDSHVTIPGSASTFTEETTTSTGGGGGGGGGDTGEKAENIDRKEVSKLYVTADTMTVYRFTDSSNPITSISYMSLKNSGFISSTIEVLKDVSTTVPEKPDGLIYRNINIWVGKAGYATESNIKDTQISFKVLKQWMQVNNIGTGSIHLKRYNDGQWTDLETELTGQDEDFFIFEAKTPGFSPFAITADAQAIEEMELAPVTNEGAILEEEIYADEVGETEITSTKIADPGLGQNSSLLLLASMSVVLLCRRKNIV